VAVGDGHVAYQVVGAGPCDVLYFYGLGNHIDLLWTIPQEAEFVRRIASFSRLILFDRRGTGASDHGVTSTWEEWTEDVHAVLDAAGSERAALVALIDAGPIAVLFAATHPDRVSSLVLSNTSARYLVDDDYPAGASPEMADSMVGLIGSTWGTPDFVRVIAPSMSTDDDYVRSYAQLHRACATPRTAAAQVGYILNSVDVREALPLIQTPTLVVHNTGNPFVPIDQGQYLSDHIAGAKFVEVPGVSIGGDPQYQPVFLDAVGEFLTGERPEVDVDRVLTSVLFTDIVGSTEQLSSVGDHRWRELLDAHDRGVREQLRQHRGREIKTTGDGFFACFDGPARAIRCARAITDVAERVGVSVRAGLHVGECEVRGDDLSGLAVHVAARIGALAGPRDVLVSNTVKELVAGSGLEFTDRGEHTLKGVPGTWKLFAADA
jgi:class 3 adenylate cyclase